jgi:hypothetical protein
METGGSRASSLHLPRTAHAEELAARQGVTGPVKVRKEDEIRSSLCGRGGGLAASLMFSNARHLRAKHEDLSLGALTWGTRQPQD